MSSARRTVRAKRCAHVDQFGFPCSRTPMKKLITPYCHRHKDCEVQAETSGLKRLAATEVFQAQQAEDRLSAKESFASVVKPLYQKRKHDELEEHAHDDVILASKRRLLAEPTNEKQELFKVELLEEAEPASADTMVAGPAPAVAPIVSAPALMIAPTPTSRRSRVWRYAVAIAATSAYVAVALSSTSSSLLALSDRPF